MNSPKAKLPFTSIDNNQAVASNSAGKLCNVWSVTSADGTTKQQLVLTSVSNFTPPTHDELGNPVTWTKVLTDRSISLKMKGEVTMDDFQATRIFADGGMSSDRLRALDTARCALKSKRTGTPVQSTIKLVEDDFYHISKRVDSSGNRTKALETRAYPERTVTYLTLSLLTDSEPDECPC